MKMKLEVHKLYHPSNTVYLRDRNELQIKTFGEVIPDMVWIDRSALTVTSCI